MALYWTWNHYQVEFIAFVTKLQYLNSISASHLEKCQSVKWAFKIDGIGQQFGLHLLINESTHLTRKTCSYIDLIFTSWPIWYFLNYAKITIVKWFIQNSIYKYKFIIHLHMNGKFGIIERQTFTISEKQ